jgi:hypothetical protein
MGKADRARVALGTVRLALGTAALVAPQLLVRRVEGAGPPSPAAVYAFRMFGIRTALIGWDLLAADGPELRRALERAPLVHATDTATATLLTVRGQVPARTGLPLVAVSGLNTALALLARR